MKAPVREEAWGLVCEWIESESLRKHVLGVEAAMRAYARKYGEDEELWAATGLLHDLDYERFPDPTAVIRTSPWSSSRRGAIRAS